MDIQYQINPTIGSEEFIDLLKRSTLGERRPINDHACSEGMLKNTNLLVTAHGDGKLLGVARSVTDFHYACYLSDLAVDKEFQSQGIGKELQILTKAQLGPRCKLILISAPAANEYYPKIGYTHQPRCWVMDGSERFS